MSHTPEEHAFIEYCNAESTGADRWVPACNGTETWTRYRNGRVYLYVINFATMRTGWKERETNIVHEQHPDSL